MYFIQVSVSPRDASIGLDSGAVESAWDLLFWTAADALSKELSAALTIGGGIPGGREPLLDGGKRGLSCCIGGDGSSGSGSGFRFLLRRFLRSDVGLSRTP